GYVNLPNGLISALTNFSIEAWVTWNGGSINQRIFDFGDNNNGENNQGTGLTYIMVTPQNSDGLPRFAISTNSGAGEMPTMGTNALPIGQQTHIAITYSFAAGTSALCINGQHVNTGPATVPLRAINDINVWLGRSQWADPYLNGQ